VLNEPQRNRSLDPEARIGSMCRQGKPLCVTLARQDEADEWKESEIARALRQLSRAHQSRFGMRCRAKEPPTFKVGGLDAERADPAREATIDPPAANRGRQEFRGQEPFLGRREAVKGVVEML